MCTDSHWQQEESGQVAVATERSEEAVGYSLRQFVQQLSHSRATVRPTPTRPRYPCSEEEMMARYGMRYATAAERTIFPTHPLVIAVIKARIRQIGQPVYIGLASPNLIVWAVESYPGCHQFRMPNGDLLHEQYNEIVWQPVSLTTPVSTIATIQQERIQQQWQQTARRCLHQHLTLADGR